MSQGILQDQSIRGNSVRWANWMSELSVSTCLFCVKRHGKLLKLLFWITTMRGKLILVVSASLCR